MKKIEKKTIGFIYNVILIIVIIIALIKCLLFVSKVSGSSMYPTYKDGEYVSVNRFAKIQREDVILLYPDTIIIGDKYIKRVVGIPGDKLIIIDGILYVKGIKNERYPIIKEPGILKNEITLADNEYFVIGDNVNYSNDSRSIGVIKRSHIIGKVLNQK